MNKRLALELFSCLLLMTLPTQAYAKQPDSVLVDDFSSAKLGAGVPRGWEAKHNTGKTIIKIESENGNKVMRLISDKSSVTVTIPVPISLKEYPILTWRWKVTKLPKGGDLRDKNKDDQAAQLYLHFAKFPEAVNIWELGYLWDGLTPEGSMLCSPQLIGCRVKSIVLRTGPLKLGQWVTERRNVYEDYKKLFKDRDIKAFKGIGLMIDSNDTNSNAECYFDDLVFKKR